MTQPEIWTLIGDEWKEPRVAGKPVGTGDRTREVDVIKLEPMLDLLEEAVVGGIIAEGPRHKIIALLRSHDRLSEGGGTNV